MKALQASAALLSILAVGTAWAQAASPPNPAVAPSSPAASTTATASAMDGQTFFQLLIAEMNAQGLDPGAAYSLMMDVAKRTRDESVFKRAIELALQNRAGDAALDAAKAWAAASPDSREAHAQVFNILLALNRVSETAAPAAALWKLVGPGEQENAAIELVRAFARASDKVAARAAFEKAFEREWRAKPGNDVLWAARASLQTAAREFNAAMASTQAAFAANPKSSSAAFAAIELVDPARPQAAVWVEQYLAQPHAARRAEVRWALARALAADRAYDRALSHTTELVRERDAQAEVWMLHGYMLRRAGGMARAPEAEAAFERVIALDATKPNTDSARVAQAHLQLAELFAAQQRWQQMHANLSQVRDESLASRLTITGLRARAMAAQGNWRDGLALFGDVRVQNAREARQRFIAEIRYLRTIKRDAEAYAMMVERRSGFGTDHDLTYEHAILAERLGKYDEAESLMREVMAARPQDAAAYNALGYSLANRNVRLDEARVLINKALELQPGEAAITDSLGWLEYRAGNLDSALKHLESAYQTAKDGEIAAHLGEVLWKRGQRERALMVLRQAMAFDPDNEVLHETVKRLGVDVGSKSR